MSIEQTLVRMAIGGHGYFAQDDIQHLHEAAQEIASLRRTRDDLHEANNRYLERARAAEAEIRRRDENTEDVKQRVQQGLRDKVTSSSDLAKTIADLGKFIDMIEARAMAVDGPVTPFCEELHAASAAEKERFQVILSKLYQFRNCWQMVGPAPLVTPEWVQEKAALEDGLDPTTGARPIGWRCFHCDDYFTSEHSARLHFGAQDGDMPACQIKAGAEGSLLTALRRAESELSDAWASIHNESTEAAKAYYAQQSRHGEQLRAAEELGYERGLRDGMTEITKGGREPATGKAIDPNWSQAWKTICEVFHALGYPRVDEHEHTAVISSIAGRADSLDFIEMLIEVEKHSGFLIDENELPSFKECTIGDVVRLLAAKMAKAGAA